MNRPIDATPTQERMIRGIDDGIERQAGHVAHEDIKQRGAHVEAVQHGLLAR
jgi:hypothetical protein